MRQAPENARCHLHLALAMVLSDKLAQLPETINTAGAKGADPACCYALASIDSLRRGHPAQANELLQKFRQALQVPSDEPLRGVLNRIVQSMQPPPRRR